MNRKGDALDNVVVELLYNSARQRPYVAYISPNQRDIAAEAA
jgi:hypothetical protein